MTPLKKKYLSLPDNDKMALKMRIIKELEISNATFYRYLNEISTPKMIEKVKIAEILNIKPYEL